MGTYVPASTGVLIDDDELLHETGRDTVTVEMKPDERVYNCFPVTIKDRLYSYRENTFEYIEPAHAAEHGVRRAPRRFMPWIKTAAHALSISAILARRSISIRRTFRFRLSPRWIALEPGDLIALSHARLGLVEEPVRIVAIEEDGRGVREVWADEWPAGLSAVQDLTPETQDGLLSVAPNPYIVDAPRISDGVAEPISRALTSLGQSSDGNRVWYRGNITNVQNGRPVLMDAAWAATTPYVLGDRRLNSGNVYVLVTPGTSGGTGPTGTGSGITDGSCVWDYAGPMSTQERVRIGAWREHAQIGGTWYVYSLMIDIVPMAYNDNFDGLKSIVVEVYDNAGNYVDTHKSTIPDRKYANTADDAHADNLTPIELQWLGPACTRFGTSLRLDAYLFVTVHSSVGMSQRIYRTVDAGSPFYAAGGATIPGGSPPTPATPPADAPPPGGTCVAPETLVLMADGTQKAAGEIVTGDRVWTRHERTGEWGAFAVTHASRHDSERLRTTFADGRCLVTSPPHRLMAGGWQHVSDLGPGALIDGTEPGTVASIEPADRGPVILLTVEGAHTYVSAGLLSHNAKKIN
jgi:hypothetical protein